MGISVTGSETHVCGVEGIVVGDMKVVVVVVVEAGRYVFY